MTTGATPFTRMAGRAGVLAAVLSVLVVLTAFTDHGFDPGGGTFLLFLLSLGAMFLFLVGLIARHRGLWWTPAMTYTLVTGVAIALIGLMAGSRPLANLGAWLTGLALNALLLGVFLEGELPRRATFLVLVTSVTVGGDDHGFLWFVGALIGFVGWTWLASAMWREPSEDQIDSRAGIVPRGTIPDASGST